MDSFFCRLLGFFVLVSLSACAVYDDDPKREHLVGNYNSGKPARVVAECVARAWNNAPAFRNPVSIRQTETGVSLPVTSRGETIIILEIDDTTEGSVSRYYKAVVWTDDAWDKAVRACQ